MRPRSRPPSPCLRLRTGGSSGLTAFFLKAKERRACEVVGVENEWVAWTEAEKRRRRRRESWGRSGERIKQWVIGGINGQSVGTSPRVEEAAAGCGAGVPGRARKERGAAGGAEACGRC